MSQSIKGTRTEKNVLMSFAGESQVHTRYLFFAEKARAENHEEIARVFDEISHQEKEHARRFLNLLEGGTVQISGEYSVDAVGDSLKNLYSAAGNENHESSDLYPDFAKVADEEGFPEIAKVFRAIAVAEKYHAQRFLELVDKLEGARPSSSETKIKSWRCSNCGFVAEGETPPERCIVCGKMREFFNAV
jgi:rubrerythrin